MGFVRVIDDSGAAWVEEATADAQTFTLTHAVDAGDTVVFACSRADAGNTITTVVSDSTDAVTAILYSGVTGPGGGGGSGMSHGLVAVQYPSGASIGDTVTVTWSGSPTFTFFIGIGAEYAGILTLESGVVSAGTGGFGTALASGAKTASAVGIAIGFLWMAQYANTITAGSGWTARTSYDAGPSSQYGNLTFEDRAASASTSYNAQGTASGATDWTAILAVLGSGASTTDESLSAEEPTSAAVGRTIGKVLVP